MSEKRFTIFGEWHKDCVIDEIRDNTGEYVTIGRVVDLLNENEQLKQSISDWSGSYDELFEDIKRLEKENEQIKHLIKEAIDNERNYWINRLGLDDEKELIEAIQ